MKARMRIFRQTGKEVVSAREMVEGMKVLTKEIKAISEGLDKQGHPRGSHEGSMDGDTPHMALEVNRKHALRSSVTWGASPRDSSLRKNSRFSPLAPSRRYNVATGSDVSASDIEDGSDCHYGDLSGILACIRKREEELMQCEVKENEQLAELVEEYKECALKIGAAKKEEEQAKRRLLRGVRVAALEKKKEELIRENQEIERMKELLLQQSQELERAQWRLRTIQGELSQLEEYEI